MDLVVWIVRVMRRTQVEVGSSGIIRKTDLVASKLHVCTYQSRTNRLSARYSNYLI